jgi:hypothetical protein
VSSSSVYANQTKPDESLKVANPVMSPASSPIFPLVRLSPSSRLPITLCRREKPEAGTC